MAFYRNDREMSRIFPADTSELIRKYTNDKNKEYGVYKETCTRCNGIGFGYNTAWDNYNASACFKCNGEGYTIKERRILTEKEKQQRERAKQRREEQREAKEEIKQIERLNQQEQEQKKELGFINTDTIYIINNNNSFDLKDDIKANGGKWNNKFKKWYFENDKLKDKYLLLKLDYNEICETSEPIEGVKINIVTDETILKVRYNEFNNYDNLGAIKDKITVTGVYTGNGYYDSKYGYTYIHKFQLINGQEISWKTSKDAQELKLEVNKTYEVKGTIKDIKGSETQLIRCKITEVEEIEEQTAETEEVESVPSSAPVEEVTDKMIKSTKRIFDNKSFKEEFSNIINSINENTYDKFIIQFIAILMQEQKKRGTKIIYHNIYIATNSNDLIILNAKNENEVKKLYDSKYKNTNYDIYNIATFRTFPREINKIHFKQTE